MASRKEFKLNDHVTFFIRKYEVFLATEILGDLQTKFLAPMATFMEVADETNTAEVKAKYVMDGIEKLSRNLNGKELVIIAKMVLNGEYITVVIDNEPPERLTENLLNRAVEDVGEMLDLITEVLKYNFSKTFTHVLSLIGKGKLNMEQQSEN